MHVASEARALAPDDEADFSVRLEADDTVGDMHAPRLEPSRPGDVRLLVEARLQLHEHGYLRLLVAGLRERLDYRGVGADAVEGLLDGEDVGVGGRSEEHTSELQSRQYLVCRLLLEKQRR